MYLFVNDELHRLRKKTAGAQFKVFSAEWNEESQEKPLERIAGHWIGI
jgi:hypothetical protein